MAEQVADKDRPRVIGKCTIYRRVGDHYEYLVAKRRPDIGHPNQWTTMGGGMDREDYENLPKVNGSWDSPLDATVKKEVEEEVGVEIGPLEYLGNFAFDRPKDGIPVFGVRFAAPYLSGEVVVAKEEFVDHAWITIADIPNYEFTGTVGKEIQDLDALLMARK